MVHHEAVKSYRANSIHESMKFGYKYSFLVFSLFWRDATILTYCVRRQKVMRRLSDLYVSCFA